MSFIVVRKDKSLYHIHLDRPQALNALDITMIEDISDAVDEFNSADTYETLLFTGEGKAFCAGGDIKHAYKAGKENPEVAKAYFKKEYALNQKLYDCSKTTVSIMDGITMGGGVGLANPCKVRICTENTRWAMPETTIGFFPDVGGAYYLSRMKGQCGLYFGLTGQSVTQPYDLISNSLATHFIPSAKLKYAFIDMEANHGIAEILEKYSEAPEQDSEIAPYIDEINFCFDFSTLDEVLMRLSQGDDWARKVREMLTTKSPTSLLLAFLHIRQAAGEEFSDVIARDLKLAEYCMHHSDFYEGVRALLLDKDRNPRWKPETVKDLDFSQINSLFT